MAIINGIALGVSAFTSHAGPITPLAYTGIRVHDSNSVSSQTVLDYIHIKNVALTLNDVQATQLYQPQVWTGNTIFLVTFENTLNGGNITGLASPITNWIVQRRKSDETVFTTLGNFPATDTHMIDVSAESGINYVYQIFGTNATEISEPLVNSIDSFYYNYVLSNISGTKSFIFDLNSDFGGYSNETAHQRYDGYNKYSAHSFGKRDFRTGDVSAILASDYSYAGINQTIEYIKDFNDFINNGEEKIFKDRKGSTLKVVTSGGVKQAPFDNRIGSQPYIISFHFEESGEVNG